MDFEEIPLTELVGSEIRTDIASLLQPETAQQLRDVLVQRGVLVFKALNLNSEQQIELSHLMGTLREEGNKGIINITLDKNINARADYLKGSLLWHIDGTHDNTPPFATLLTAIKLSDVGGDTEFANTYAAYEALSDDMKTRLADLKALHSFEVSTRRAGVEPTPENVAEWRKVPDKTHQIVWTHKTGRKSLVVGCHASHIPGMPREEGEQLLQELQDWVTQPQFVYRHQWTPGDLVIWDNTGVMHHAEPYPLDSGRLMRRTTLQGEEAFT